MTPVNLALNKYTSMYQALLNDKLAQKAYNRQKDFYNLQNEYNDPSAVVQRYQNAGVNPTAAFGVAGSYQPAQQSASVPEAGGVSAFPTQVGSISVPDPLQIEKQLAEIDNIKAQTQKVKGDTLDPEETKRGQVLTNNLTAAKILNTESSTQLTNLDKQFKTDVYDAQVATEKAKLDNIVRQYDLLSQQIAESASKTNLNKQTARESVSRILLNEVNASLARTQQSWVGKMNQAQIDLIQSQIEKAASEISLNNAKKFLTSSQEWTEDARRRGIQLDNMFKSIDLGIGKDGKVDNAAIFVRQADNILKLLKGWL